VKNNYGIPQGPTVQLSLIYIYIYIYIDLIKFSLLAGVNAPTALPPYRFTASQT